MITPRSSGFLKQGRHRLYFERFGEQGRTPWLFVHGGPGGKSAHYHLEFFDVLRSDILFFDQRGCGKSEPTGELRENTTADLVCDIEALRRLAGWTEMNLFGVSWGTWLVSEYVRKYPQNVAHFILACPFAPISEVLELSTVHLLDALKSWNNPLKPPQIPVGANPFATCLTDLLSSNDAVVQSAARLMLEAEMRVSGTRLADTTFEAMYSRETVAALSVLASYAANSYFRSKSSFPTKHKIAERGCTITGDKDVFGLLAQSWFSRIGLKSHTVQCVGHQALHPDVLHVVRRQMALSFK